MMSNNKKGNLPKPKQQQDSGAMPSIGNDASSEYLKMFYPRPEADMRWVYTMLINIQGISVNGELSMEVVEVADKKVKIRTIMGDQNIDSEMSIDSFSPIPMTSANTAKTGYIFEGHEDIIVPAGEFRGSVKLSTNAEGGKTYLWLHKGTGPVKFSVVAQGVPADLLLKEFKN